MNYSVRDLVLLITPERHIGLSEELLPQRTDPYRILRETTDVTYIVEPVIPPTDARSSSTEWFTSRTGNHT